MDLGVEYQVVYRGTTMLLDLLRVDYYLAFRVTKIAVRKSEML